MNTSRRSARLGRYVQLQTERPHLFINPPGAAYEILFDRTDQDFVADTCAAALRERGQPEEYADIGVVYEDPYFIVVRDAVRFRDGSRGAYVRFMSANPGTNAAVLPLLPDGRVILVRHFRHGSRQWYWEIPRGFAKPDEDGAATARQELWEEIGVWVEDVHPLGWVSTDADPDAIYVAWLPAEAANRVAVTGAGTEEGIDELRLFTGQQLLQLINEGQVADMYLLSAYALATAKGLMKI